MIVIYKKNKLVYLIELKLLNKYYSMDLQFSCPISELGRIKQFRMCALNTKSLLYYRMIRIESYLCLTQFSLSHSSYRKKLFYLSLLVETFYCIQFHHFLTYPQADLCFKIKRYHFIRTKRFLKHCAINSVQNHERDCV